MAYEQPDFMIGFLKADVNFSSVLLNQYTCVDLGASVNTTGTGQGKAAAVAPTAGGYIAGILQNNPLENEAATIMNTGVSMAKVSGSGSIGDLLATDVNGMLLKATSGQVAVARALEQYNAGETTSVLLGFYGKQ